MSDLEKQLSPERLAQIEAGCTRWQAFVAEKPHWNGSNTQHLAVTQVEELLADRQAFRAAVAEQLGRLLYLPQLIAEMDSKAAYAARYQNMLIRQAVTRLGLTLP